MTNRKLMALCMALAVSPFAHADNLNDNTALNDTSRVVDLSEVVVIKETSALRQQPVSSTTMGMADLERLEVHDLRQLSLYVPSFVMPDYGTRYTSSMYVRGIGSRVNSPAVGIYVDNVPVLNKSMFNTHLYQLERVDVMRGPQGTLYGQNTEGGLVRMHTVSPLSRQGTSLNLSFGSAFWRMAEVSYSTLLTPGVGLSLSAFYDGQEGPQHNATTGQRALQSDEGGLRLRLQWQAADQLQMGLTADYQYVDQYGFAYGLEDSVSHRAGQSDANRPGHYRRHMLTTGLSLSWQQSWGEVSYGGSWQYLNDRMKMDIDYRPQDYMHMRQVQLQNATTHELLVSATPSNLWHHTTGAFFSYQALKTDAPVCFDPAMNDFLSATVENAAYQGMLQSMAQRMGLPAAQALIASAGGCHVRLDMETIPGHFRTPQANYGLFHQTDLHLTPQVTATLGLRYDLSLTSIDYHTVGTMHLDESVMGVSVKADVVSQLQHHHSTSFAQWLPKVGLTWRTGANGSNLYATVSKGYRAGGFNIQMFSDILQAELQGASRSARGDVTIDHTTQDYDNIRNTIAYKPEESWNYEVGAHLNLLGPRLRLDLAAYLMQIRNQQLSVMAGNYGFGRMMVNAGRSLSTGLEASMRGSMLDNRLLWGVSYGLTHAEFRDYTDSIATQQGTQAVSYRGKRVPFIPRHTLAAYADWRFNVGDDLLQALVFGANLTAQGDIWWDEGNTARQPFYALLGAHADAHMGRFVVSLWGRNLTDTRYHTFSVESQMAGSVGRYSQRGWPLQVGLDVRLKL